MFRLFTLFRVRGIPVRVHPTLLLFLLVVGVLFGSSSGPAGVLATLLLLGMLFGFVLLHELGHAVTAQTLGVPVRSITLHPLGGLASMDAMPRDPRAELLITAAGPAVNFALAGAFAVLHLLAPVGLLKLAVIVNLGLGLFNLLPAFPLDGGRVLRALLATRLPYLRATTIAARTGQVVAVLMGLAGLAIGHLMLAMIGVFVFMVAGAELAAVRRSEPWIVGPGFATRVNPAAPYRRTIVTTWPAPPDR